MKSKKPIHQPKERDRFGCMVDSISGSVNAVVTNTWQNSEDITKKAGVVHTKGRARLYAAAARGVFESRRLFQYRLKQVK